MGKQTTDWMVIGREQVAAAARAYPNSTLADSGVDLVVMILVVEGAVDPTVVTGVIRVDENGREEPWVAELFGPRLGVVIHRDADGTPHGSTMADYNQRYWRVISRAAATGVQPPRQFLLADTYEGGDDDRRNWEAAFGHFRKLGLNAVGPMGNNSPAIAQMMSGVGLTSVVGAVYNPPGYAFDFEDPRTKSPDPPTPDGIEHWASSAAARFRDAGFKQGAVRWFAMSDEPGWYYPKEFDIVTNNPAAFNEFHEYLRGAGLSPSDFGKGGWQEVTPIGRSHAAADLPTRRLFYWSMRFFPWASATHFSNCARALQRHLGDIPIAVNWDFFAGRSYNPGAVGNQPNRQSPDAAMGGHDWFEFGRLKGSSALWTETWMGDDTAYYASIYAAKLASAARKGNVGFGAYLIGRTTGDRAGGLLKKAMAFAGHGAKSLCLYTFGPEYNFPGNSYADKLVKQPRIASEIAELATVLRKSEDLLWPARARRGQVALLYPRSSQMWDDPAGNQGILDITNTDLNQTTVDYMAEVHDLNLALHHSAIPVEWIEEEDLTASGLSPYRVIYVTAPNVPAEGQNAITEWVNAGGTLVTCSGAATRDRYGQATSILRDLSHIDESDRDRMTLPTVLDLKMVDKVHDPSGASAPVYGTRGRFARAGGTAVASFDDGSPAIVRSDVGSGRVFHFVFLPAVSYFRSQGQNTTSIFPTTFDAALRDWITLPVKEARITLPVEVPVPLIEAPVLETDQGWVISLVNWADQPVKRLRIRVNPDFHVQRVATVRQDNVAATRLGANSLDLFLPLDAIEVVRLYRA